MTSIRFYKSPNAVLDYSIDWSDFLVGGDSLLTSSWSSSSTDLVIDSDNFSTNSTTAWISGGISGTNYTITNLVTTLLGRQEPRDVSIMVVTNPNQVADLIYLLRLQLGDIVPASYRYMNEWLTVAIESSIAALQRWWGDKYIMDRTGGYIIRNPNYTGTFLEETPPEIMDRDVRPIILMASILIKSGQLEANSWNAGSWKDAEIAVSNIEGSKAKQFGIGLDWEELKMYVLPPTKRLSQALRIQHPSTEE